MNRGYGAGGTDEGGTVQDALSTSLSLVGRLAELALQSAGGVAAALVHEGEAAAEQARVVGEDLLAQTQQNAASAVARATTELERALARLGVATADDVAVLLERVRQLEAELRQTAESASALLTAAAGAGAVVAEDDGNAP